MVKLCKVPRGTSDILPSQVSQWQEIEKNTRQIFTNYYFKEIRTPIFEETELFVRSMGKGSEVVQKQMLKLAAQNRDEKARVELSGLALRPEGTAAVLRSYIENHFDRSEGISKLYYVGPMFRGERPQKGRLRQFHQIGAEIIGPSAAQPFLDAEIIALCVDILKASDVKDFEIQINTLGTSEDRCKFAKWLRAQLKDDMGKLDDALMNSFDENVFRILDSKDKAARALVEKLPLDHSYLSKESIERFSKVKEALDHLGIAYKEMPGMVRGLDYYNHTVFEITHPALGSQDAIGAGGRYNDLFSQLGGKPQGESKVGGVGFSLGMERMLLATDQIGLVPQSVDAFVVPMGDDALAKGFEILYNLRSENIVADMGYAQGSVKSLMRQANKMKAKFCVIIGDEELKKNSLVLKDMNKDGDNEQTLKMDQSSKELIGTIKERLG